MTGHHHHLSGFEVGFAAAAALDAAKRHQRNTVYAQADAAQLWYEQTGQMTDAGYNAIIQANYLRATERPPSKVWGVLFLLFVVPAAIFGLWMIGLFLLACFGVIS